MTSLWSALTFTVLCRTNKIEIFALTTSNQSINQSINHLFAMWCSQFFKWKQWNKFGNPFGLKIEQESEPRSTILCNNWSSLSMTRFIGWQKVSEMFVSEFSTSITNDDDLWCRKSGRKTIETNGYFVSKRQRDNLTKTNQPRNVQNPVVKEMTCGLRFPKFHSPLNEGTSHRHRS
jgi:hypothetical protein